MKRGAEKELSKDSEDADDVEEVVAEGFLKADEATLTSRPMRSLPKRSLTNNLSTPQPISEPSSGSKFGSFSGFSTPSFSSTPPPSVLGAQQISQSSILKQGPTTSMVSPNASSTAKTFASFVNASSHSSVASSHQSPQSKSATSSANEPSDAISTEYYKSLRGLNVSFVDALTKLTIEDPFADISDLLDQYKRFRLDVQKEFGEKSKESPEPQAPPAKTSVMPRPPVNFSGFSGFGQPTSNPVASAITTGGFQPKLTSTSTTESFFAVKSTPAATSSGFSFTAAGSRSSSTGESVNVEQSESPNPSLSFGQGGSNSFGAGENKTVSPAFSFGASTKTESPLTSAPFSFGVPSTSLSHNSSSASFVFGSKQSTASAFGSPPSIKSGDAPSTALSPPATFGGFGGFGKPLGSGSIGNPVGFEFGSPSKALEAKTRTTGDASDKDEESTIQPRGSTAGADSDANPGLSSKSTHDEEGPGEEEEETLHSIKSKAFRMRKADENQEGSPWLELGIGILRLKKHKESNARRLLLRNSSTGKININFNLYLGLKPTQNKKTVTFVGHDDAGGSQTYSVRLANDEQAKTLKEVLDREIAFLAAKSDD